MATSANIAAAPIARRGITRGLQSSVIVTCSLANRSISVSRDSVTAQREEVREIGTWPR